MRCDCCPACCAAHAQGQCPPDAPVYNAPIALYPGVTLTFLHYVDMDQAALPALPADALALHFCLTGRAGFALTEGAFQVTRKQTCHFRKNGKRPVTLLAVTYEGILQVTDPEAFREMLCQGIGRGKAYGLGLMTILHGGSSHG